MASKSKVVFNSITLNDLKFQDHVAGYNALEVDKTLDKIIDDYEWYEHFYQEAKSYIAELESSVKKLNDTIRDREIELAKYKATLDKIKDKKNVTSDNLSLYLRITALENALWQKGVDPDKVK